MHEVSLWNSRFSAKVTLVLTLMVALLYSCNEDDDNSTPLCPQVPVTFTLSGAREGQRSGSASVSQSEVNNAHRLTFSFTDADANGPGSFNLSLEQGPDTVMIPLTAPGSYSLGGLTQDEDFQLLYTDIATTTAFLGESFGTLVITSSDSEFVEGTFEFSTSTLTNPDNVLNVTNGQFRAVVQN